MAANEANSDFSMVAQLEDRLAVGRTVNSLEDAYLSYCEYAHAKGFSVRKGDQRYFTGSNEIQAKDFECSSEGKKDEKRSKDRVAVYRKPSMRSSCKARLRVGREKGGDWTVTRFITEHNHEMVDSDQTHLLRSSRNISYVKRATAEAMVNAGISVADVVSYAEKKPRAPPPLDRRSVITDAYNHMNGLKRHTKVEEGEACALLHHFINKSNKEPFFYWNVQLDDDNSVMNLFFRDYKSQTDYESFGDVLSFDTVCRANKYNITCASFVGLNHHKQNVMFGLAFMSDETESSFEWLFRTFLESMNGKQPESIVTDQCQAKMNAVETVFVNSHHRLCHRHINQNAQSHLRSLYGDAKFRELWHKCMNGCDSEEEFDNVWKDMLELYGLGAHTWLNDMYRLKHKWSTAYNNHRFSGGMLATCRCEGMGSMLKRAYDGMCTLYDLVLNYEILQMKWREKERAEDTRCRLGKPAMIVKDNPMLKQVSDLYTFAIYGMFESELIGSLNTHLSEQGSSEGCNPQVEFIIKCLDENSKLRKVLFDRVTRKVTCSCRMFESIGILCKHALKVLNYVHVHLLPEMYIKNRWMKRSNKRNFCVLLNETEYVVESETEFVNRIMRSMYDLAMRCKGNRETRKMLSKLIDEATVQANVLFDTLNPNEGEADVEGCGSSSERNQGNQAQYIQDPIAQEMDYESS